MILVSVFKIFSLSVPMNKIVVGNAPSPNLASAQSRIGSLSNTQHRVINCSMF